MPRPVIRLFIAFALITLFTGCDNGTASPAFAAETRPAAPSADLEPRVVKGRVTDASGTPIPAVEVFADHTMFHNANLVDVTDANGSYRIELGDIAPSSWRVGAYITREFDGISHKISLHPDDAAAFSGASGAIRNLQWRITGRTPEGGHYGGQGYVHLDGDLDSDHVLITFTPIGPLIDGSRMDTFSRKPDGSRINDLPLGRYIVSALYQPPGEGGEDLLVRVRDAGDYAASVEAGFKLNAYDEALIELQAKRR